MDFRKFGYVIFFFILFSIAFICFSTIAHEDIHARIMTAYGCSDAKYKIVFPLSVVTYCNDNIYQEGFEEVKLHIINEIVGYNTISIILAIFVAILMKIMFEN